MILSGIGEDVRGNMLKTFDMSRKQRADDEDIILKGKLETQQGMAALRGTTAGASSTSSNVERGSDLNIAHEKVTSER